MRDLLFDTEFRNLIPPLSKEEREQLTKNLFSMTNQIRQFKGDKWNKLLGSRIPDGALVEVVKFWPRRRVWVKYQGEIIGTMLFCLKT